jgi:hypothetical protein
MTPDFSSLADLKRVIQKYAVPADGVYREKAGLYAVMLTFIPGPTYRGVLPKNQEVLDFMRGHNWRKVP